MKSVQYTLIALLCLSFCSFHICAQQKEGTLRGLVTNAEDGEVIPFANVLVKDAKGNIVSGTITDMDGIFAISELDEGQYTLTVSYIGFSTKTFKNLKIESGKTKTMNAFLTEEMTTLEECVVTYKAPLIERYCGTRCFRSSCCCFRCREITTDTIVSEILNSDSISIYPNPSNGVLNINTKQSHDKVVITNMNGQEVQTIESNDKKDVNVKLHHLPPAPYVVHFISGGQKVSKIWILAH